MINKEKLKELLNEYKKEFVKEHWVRGKYKWEAVKCFQDNWDVNAPDFAEMLKKSLSKTGNLLASPNKLPRRMITIFSEIAPEEVRNMFIELFDDSLDLGDRIKKFKESANMLLEHYGNGAAQHYQYDSVVSTYLWLKHPDKYYIYQFQCVKAVSLELKSDYIFKKGDHNQNILNCMALYDEICAALKNDAEICNLLNSQLTADCFSDPKLHTLTIDFGFYISCIIKKRFSDTSKIITYQENETTNTVLETKDVPVIKKYSKEDFLSQVFMSEEKYDRLVAVLKRKKNIILQGAPGVGKTFSAKRLAYSIIGEIDNSRIEFVQFHQNYSYEDFIMGYKPVADGFELKYGVFYQFCQKAADDPDKDYFFLIDEINRGNLSKIFGELLMLIEKDYRGTEISLAYNDKKFYVPKGLHIIGMMNTADRSLAMIDYALRRRFSFFDMEPGFDSDSFKRYAKKLNNSTFDQLIMCIKELNREITEDKSLGKGFCIGHSYFCGAEECTVEWMRDVVDYDILPMLSEYWFDNTKKIDNWKKELHGVFR